MIKIKVPATTANLGPGFDTLGLALNLYNEFYFEKADDFIYKNMPQCYANKNNLIIRASLKTYEYLNIEPICYELSTNNSVPSTRGLGSSATCIVAGILAASYFSKRKLTDEEIIKLGTEIEGHPDNISPAVLGGLTVSINQEKIITSKYYVNPNIIFTVVIPRQKLKTSDSRNVLPESYPLSDVVNNIGRAMLIPKALNKGNIDLLYELMKDKIHEPYRFPLINNSDKFINYSKQNKIPFCLSGSGSCMLFITKESIKKDLEILDNDVKVKELKVSTKGGRIYEK